MGLGEPGGMALPIVYPRKRVPVRSLSNHERPSPVIILSWIGFIIGVSALLGILVSDLIYHWLRWGPSTYIQIYGLTALSSAAFFNIRVRSYLSRGLETASIAYAFFDVLFVLGLLGLIHFGILLPFLDPARVERIGGLRVGLTEVIFASLVLILMRPALQMIIRGQEQRLAREAVEARRLAVLLESLSRRIEELSKPLKDRGEEDLKKSLEILLKRIEELRSVLASRPSYTRVYGIVEPSIIPRPRIGGKVEVKVESHSPDTVEAPKSQTALPDAAVDNPWIDLLKKRGKKG